MRRRSLVVATMVIGLAMVTAPVASAAKPIHGRWSGSGTIDAGLPCSGPVSDTYQESIRYADRFLKDGTVEEVGHVTEIDVFTANNKSLQGTQYAWDYKTHALDLDFTTVYSNVATGTFMSFMLPNGTRIVSSGQIDFTGLPGPGFIPDKGHAPDLAALCRYFFG